MASIYKFSEPQASGFSCPLCRNTDYPIYDHDLMVYQQIASILRDVIKIKLTSKIMNKYATILYDNNVTTIEKLQYKLEHHPKFLEQMGFDDYDALFIMKHFQVPTHEAAALNIDTSDAKETSATRIARGGSTLRPHLRDRELLISFFNATNGPHWVDHTNWCTTAPVAQWFGITVDHHTEQVTKIHLPDNNVKGTLPLNLYEMTSLTKIDLSNNVISGTLPAIWSEFPKLEVLYLRDNHLSGPLPVEWKSLTHLIALDLDGNKLTGRVPSEWRNMTSLSACILYNNLLESNNNSIRVILPNCRNIDSETSAATLTSDSLLSPVAEGDEDAFN